MNVKVVKLSFIVIFKFDESNFIFIFFKKININIAHPIDMYENFTHTKVYSICMTSLYTYRTKVFFTHQNNSSSTYKVDFV